MSKISILLTVIAISLLVACQSRTPMQPTDPTTVIDEYIAALNARDVDRALQFVADDAIFSPGGDQIKGKAEIRKFIEDNAAQLVSVERVGEFKVDGERLTWTEYGMFKNPFGQGANMEVVVNFEAIVRNGKIISLAGTPAP